VVADLKHPSLTSLDEPGLASPVHVLPDEMMSAMG